MKNFDYDKNISLVQRISMQLRKMIRESVYQMGDKLPIENELAAQFKVSRGTVRAALQILEQSGIVVKKRGIGTFVSKEPMLINNLSMNFGISKAIESIGATPGTDYINIYTAVSDEAEIYTRLELPEQSMLFIIERVRTANGKKVAFTQDVFGRDRFFELTSADSTEELERHLAQNQSLYAFLDTKLETPIHHAISHILPIKCENAHVTELLGISENSVLLMINQVDYTTNGEPIWMAREYHIADMFTFSVHRSM